MPVLRDRSGERYGRLLAIKSSGRTEKGHIVWECVCDCGNVISVPGGRLSSGNTQSCGCLHREITIARATKHGRSKTKEYVKEISKKSRTKLKREVMEAYGGKCACCGEDNIIFLAIDHVHNNGNEERKIIKQARFYTWLRMNNYPKGDYQVLCFNCNFAKRLGVCPHKGGENDFEQLEEASSPGSYQHQTVRYQGREGQA